MIDTPTEQLHLTYTWAVRRSFDRSDDVWRNKTNPERERKKKRKEREREGERERKREKKGGKVRT